MKKIILTIIFILFLSFPNITYALNPSNAKNHNINSGSLLKIKMIFLHLNKQYPYGIHWNNLYYNKPSLLKKYGTVKVKKYSIKISGKPSYNILNIKTFNYPMHVLESNGRVKTYNKHYQTGIHIIIAVSDIRNGLFYNGEIITKKLIRFVYYKIDYSTYKLPTLNYISFPIAGKALYNRISYAGEVGYERNIIFVLVQLCKIK